MKPTYLRLFLVVLSVLSGCKHGKIDSVDKADLANSRMKNENAAVAELLVRLTDGRLMDIREGEEAVRKGTSEQVREYGQLMLHDQKELLGDLVLLARERNIVLPEDISDTKASGFKELDSKTGIEFDKKFVKMIRRDHERDIHELKNASAFHDTDIREFAQKKLPLIESHLAKIKAIEQASH